MSTQILACPWCGFGAAIYREPERAKPWCRVECIMADCGGGPVEKDEFTAIESWNRVANLYSRAGRGEKALREIEKGEGRFSLDPMTHASNTIDDMKATATVSNVRRGDTWKYLLAPALSTAADQEGAPRNAD